MKRCEVLGATQLGAKIGHLAVVQPMTVFVTPCRNLLNPLTQFLDFVFVKCVDQYPTMLVKKCLRLNVI